MKNKLKKFRYLLFIPLAGLIILFSATTDNYFEISKNLDIFATLFKELNIYYVDETNPGDLIKTSIDAMLEKLDPYTNYIAESDIEDYRFMTTGQYGGIGALIRKKDNYVMIAEPYENFPAQKAGLIAGDVILEINGKTAKDKSTSEMSKILKGQPGTEVKLLIKREDEPNPLEKTLIREEVKISDVPYFGIVKDSIGYIKLTSFTETASKEVKNALESLKENNSMKSLVLDLRGNGGGLLREAVNIVNLFVEKGQVVVSTKGKITEWDRSHVALNSPVDTKIPLTVLIDGNSASASEIVAGALQDLDRAVIIGNKSYGKGLVQQTRNLSYNAKLKVTVAKYYTPSGRCIQKLDYSHRSKDGVVSAIPDSLIAAFKTKGGRVVYDGEGITPDLHVEELRASQISQTLLNKMLLFDFASVYRKKHPAIPPAKDFRLTEEDYKELITFLDGKDYVYTTRSEKMLEDLEKVARKEKYLDDVQKEYEALKTKLHRNKNEDLKKFKDEIKEILESEIVSRYYYQKGRVENYLSYDPDLKKAIEVLSDEKLMASVFDKSFVAKKIKNEEEEELKKDSKPANPNAEDEENLDEN